jgi:hypothetical protein
MAPSQQVTLSQDELQQVLEPLIRRVIREELARLVQQQPDVFVLHPEMSLYEDMEDIAQRNAAETIELFTHDEVWNA